MPVREETVLTGDTKGYITSYTSEEFTLTQETAITIPAAGSSGKVIDWVYIVKTGDAAVPVDVTIGSTGYATLYYGDRALEVPEGVKAFTYTMTGNTLKENTTYEAGDVIPAGEAVVLNGTAGNYTFNLGTATAEKDAQNVLKGSDVEATFNEAGHKYYMLSTNDAGEVGFYWYNDDGSAINCAAHKAYLFYVTLQFRMRQKKGRRIGHGSRGDDGHLVLTVFNDLCHKLHCRQVA